MGGGSNGSVIVLKVHVKVTPLGLPLVWKTFLLSFEVDNMEYFL